MVPIGLRGSGWPATECKKITYLDIFPVDYLWKFAILAPQVPVPVVSLEFAQHPLL